MSEPTRITSRRKEPADSEIGAPPVIGAAARKRRLWLWLVPVVLLLVVFAVLFRFNPSQNSFYPLCMFHRVTRLQCPGCGGLRATHHLLHGDVVMALRFNPLAVLALPVIAWFAVRRWRLGSAAAKISQRTVAVWAWGLFAVVVLFWIVRNLPLEFFRMPAE